MQLLLEYCLVIWYISNIFRGYFHVLPLRKHLFTKDINIIWEKLYFFDIWESEAHGYLRLLLLFDYCKYEIILLCLCTICYDDYFLFSPNSNVSCIGLCSHNIRWTYLHLAHDSYLQPLYTHFRQLFHASLQTCPSMKRLSLIQPLRQLGHIL